MMMPLFRKKSGPVSLTVVSAPSEDVMIDAARVDLSHRPFCRAGGVIVIRAGDAKVRVVARGLAGGMTKEYISLASAVRSKLKVKPGQTYDFVFEQAGWRDGLYWAWHATDAMPRIAARLGVVSVVLGFIGAVLGGWSLYLTL